MTAAELRHTSAAPVGPGFWDRRDGQSSWWERREDETEEERNKRMNHARFMAFDPDDPDLELD